MKVNDTPIIGAYPVTKPSLFIGELSMSIFWENLKNSNPISSWSLYLCVKWIIGQRKAFHMQRSPEYTFARKQTVDINILMGMVTKISGNLSE